MKKIASMLALGLTVAMLGGCANAGASSSAEATAENPMVLTLAHGLSETHTVHIAMTEFADKVEERTDGRIQVRILPNGQLGSENENMEQLMAGVISMTKVSAPGLATYNESYHTFGLPYIFDDAQDFYHVMDSEPMQEFFLSSADDGFVTITYYTSGARSFYTVNKPIRTPADLKGLKIRVQDMKSQTDMLNALGGIPVAMAYGDVYTSLQTGIIDGTENNETALTTGKHGEICKVFSTTARHDPGRSGHERQDLGGHQPGGPGDHPGGGPRVHREPQDCLGCSHHEAIGKRPQRWAWSLSTMWIKRRSARRPVEWWTSTAHSTRAYRVSLTSSIL